jgi:hypothetical protein
MYENSRDRRLSARSAFDLLCTYLESTAEERVLQLQEKKQLVFDGTVGKGSWLAQNVDCSRHEIIVHLIAIIYTYIPSYKSRRCKLKVSLFIICTSLELIKHSK